MNDLTVFAWFFVGVVAGSVRRWSGWFVSVFSSRREGV